MSTSSQHVRERLLQSILSRAATDPAFRAGLLHTPKETISQAFGVIIPAPFRVRFVEKDADLDALVVLPDLQAERGELSDGDLEAVNGGIGGLFGSDEPW
jgi:hypothetical protein